MQHHGLKPDSNKAFLTVEGHRLDNLPVPSMPWRPCSGVHPWRPCPGVPCPGVLALIVFVLLNINYRQIKSTWLIMDNSWTILLWSGSIKSWSRIGSFSSFIDLHWRISLTCTSKAWLTWKLLVQLFGIGGQLPPLIMRLLLSSWSRPTGLCFLLFSIIQACTYMCSSN